MAVSAYAWRARFDSEQFADRATAALQHPSVRQAIADRVTDELVLSRQPDLVAGRPVIASTVSAVAGGEAFASLFRRAVRDVHGAVFPSDRDTVTLTLADVAIVVSAALQQIEPELTSKMQPRERIVVLSRRIGSVTADLARLANTLRWLTYVLGTLSLIVAGAALTLARDRCRIAIRLGWHSSWRAS